MKAIVRIRVYACERLAGLTRVGPAEEEAPASSPTVVIEPPLKVGPPKKRQKAKAVEPKLEPESDTEEPARGKKKAAAKGKGKRRVVREEEEESSEAEAAPPPASSDVDEVEADEVEEDDSELEEEDKKVASKKCVGIRPSCSRILLTSIVRRRRWTAGRMSISRAGGRSGTRAYPLWASLVLP
jgi:hypothetical protein